MKLTVFNHPGEFLSAVRPHLEAGGAVSHLMYGLALGLAAHPERMKTAPFIAALEDAGAYVLLGLMTPPNKLQVLSLRGERLDAACQLLAQELHENAWPLPGVIGPNADSLAFAQAWQALTARTPRLAVHERLYELRQVQPPPLPAGRMRLAGQDDLDLLARWRVDFETEALPGTPPTLDQARENISYRIADGDLLVWEVGQPRALAGRGRPTPQGASIGPVYTPPEFRGRGYATALTAGLSQRILDEGKQFVVLFTDLGNPVSNSIYQKIGFSPVCDYDMYEL